VTISSQEGPSFVELVSPAHVLELPVTL